MNLSHFYLIKNGRIIDLDSFDSKAFEDGLIRVVPRLIGGKGGFGSLLRAMGKQIDKTTNREACRDLAGRRIRDINNGQRIKDWFAGDAEREQQRLQARKEKRDKILGRAVPSGKSDQKVEENLSVEDDENKPRFKETKNRKRKADKDFGVDPSVKFERDRMTAVENLEDALTAGLSKGLPTSSSKQTSNDKKPKVASSKLDDYMMGDDLDIDDVSSSDDGESENPPIGKIEPKAEIEEEAISKSTILNDEVSTPVVKTECSDGMQPPSCPPTPLPSGVAGILLDPSQRFGPIDLSKVTSIDQLLKLGPIHLKHELVRLGAKCGGTLQDRANRLYHLKKN